MESLVIILFTLMVAFESVDSQYNWSPYNFGIYPNPHQTSINRNYQPPQSNGYHLNQPSNSYYPATSNGFFGQPQNYFYTAPSYRPYQTSNSYFPQPSYVQPSNVNNQRPQSLHAINQNIGVDHIRRPQDIKTNSNTAQRVSERKCEEYLKMSQRNVSVSSLTLRPTFHNIQMDNCETSQGLIINGENAKTGEFPHMAAIGYRERNQGIQIVCGGSLISDQFVLTAAHCRVTNGKSSSIVRLGVLNLKERDSNNKDIGIDSFINHEKYDPNTQKNDIALIKLLNKVELSKFIRPACIATPNNAANFQKAVVTGWGLTEAFTDLFSNILQKAEITIKSINTCQTFLSKDNVDNTQICAGDKIRDTCLGDSGGPLQIISPRNKCLHIVVGITSYGSEFCGAENSVAVYTKVASYLDWIEQKVWGSNL